MAEGFTVVHLHDSTQRVTLVDTPSFDGWLASQCVYFHYVPPTQIPYYISDKVNT